MLERNDEAVERHARLRELFLSAVELAGKARQSFVEEACAEDLEMRADLESLLEIHEAVALPGARHP